MLIAVPVETIEAWLLASRAIRHPGQGSLRAEDKPRYILKREFYGRPAATERDVRTKALPLIREMNDRNLSSLKDYSQSFREFADQVERSRPKILEGQKCW